MNAKEECSPLLQGRYWLALALFACIFSLSACLGPQLYHQQLSVLDKGITPSQATAQLHLAPRSTYSVQVNGRSYEFHRYMLNNGVQIDPYYLAFMGQKLVYWGYVTEFRRQPDRDLNEALNLVLLEVGNSKP